MTLRGVKAQKPFAKAFDLAQKYRADLVATGATRPLFAKAKKENRGELYIYEQIGEDWWTGGGVTAASVATALKEAKGVDGLDIFINSPGGDVFEAKAIYAQLCRFEADKVVHVDGLCASAATFIAMAGNKIITAPAATWMVHEAWAGAVGRAEDMRAMGALLDMMNGDIAGIYAARTGRTCEEMLAVMAGETWMNATEALAQKFTDEIAPAVTADAEETGEEAATASAHPMVRSAARTQEQLTSVSPATLLAMKAEMRRRNHPGRPGEQRTPAGR